MNVEKKQYIVQRRVMGILVMLLAPLSILFGLIGINTNPEGWWHSISDTWYANSQVIMAVIIAISAYFFCTYGGYDWRDRVVNLMSGIGLFGILVFPCGNEGTNGLVGLFNLPINISSKIHVAFALLAFTGFFINEGFLFTISSGELTKEKKKRNFIYRLAAFCIIPVAAVLIILANLNIGPKNMVWIAELVALEPCGLAWLVKGETLSILNDK